MSKLKFMNIEVDNLTMSEAINAMDLLIQNKENAYVVTPNVDHIVQRKKLPGLRNVSTASERILRSGRSHEYLYQRSST